MKRKYEMSFSEEIKKIRQRFFLTQSDFAKEITVSFSAVNRWEVGKAKPNLSAMKKIKLFCDRNNIEYGTIEDVWLNYKTTSDKS